MLHFHPWGSPTGEEGVETDLEEGWAIEREGRRGGRRKRECGAPRVHSLPVQAVSTPTERASDGGR